MFIVTARHPAFRGAGLRVLSSGGRDQPSFKKSVKEEFLFRDGQERARRDSSVDDEEVHKFKMFSTSWWDPNGSCKVLHAMNELRVDLILRGLESSGRLLASARDSAKPLTGLSVLDVGCGGGILSEPLARLGAQVTGLDPAAESIEAAREHAEKDESVRDNVEYIVGSAEDLALKRSGCFDAVVASEVLEHSNNQDTLVRACAALAKESDGSLFFTTLNRTRSAYLAGVVGAECLLGLLPSGTHDWDKFVSPEELDAMLTSNGCQIRLIHGMFYWPVFNQWTWIAQTNVNYAVYATRRVS